METTARVPDCLLEWLCGEHAGVEIEWPGGHTWHINMMGKHCLLAENKFHKCSSRSAHRGVVVTQSHLSATPLCFGSGMMGRDRNHPTSETAGSKLVSGRRFCPNNSCQIALSRLSTQSLSGSLSWAFLPPNTTKLVSALLVRRWVDLIKIQAK